MAKKKKSGKAGAVIAMGLLCAALAVGNYFAYTFNGIITDFLCGTGTVLGAGALAESDELCRAIEEEGIVLLKNDRTYTGQPSLPLSANVDKVNVFGWGATDAGFTQVGVGSGSSPIYPSKSVKLLEALTKAGIEYNTEIIDAYKDFNNTPRETDRNTKNVYRLYEPSSAFYTTDMLANAQAFSSTALVVISRISGENTITEVPTVQDQLYTEKGLMATDTTRTYLELTKYEEDLIEMCYDHFDNVVMIVNSSNTMHLNLLDTDLVSSAISVGVVGQSGAAVIPDILWGNKTPSGKLASTHVYDPTMEAAYANHTKQDGQIQYLEDIYVGYKWYETADAEGFWDSSYAKSKWGIENGYEDVVQYPFGFGLSYTEFDWTVSNLSIPSGRTLTKDSKISFDVTVKNVGDVPGKDVVQVYADLPYAKGGIEKSASELVAFFKTPELPADGKTVYTETVTIDLYELASYDAYDKNNNGFAGYEIENVSGKDYKIKIMTDAHTLKDCANNVISYGVPSDGIRFEEDPVTGVSVENRMTGSTAYAGVPIDGSTVGAETKYMSRSDFTGTFPTTHAKTPSNSAKIEQAFEYMNKSYDQTEMPTMGVDSKLRLFKKADGSFASKADLEGGAELVVNEALFEDLSDYESVTWDLLINQMTASELRDIVENGGFKTQAVASIGKPKALDKDGPAGLNEVITGNYTGKEEWTAFPGEAVLACTWNVELAYQNGLSVAKEANATAINGWYAPTVNLHRSAYNGRNYEAFSEDAFLSGKFAANVIVGAKTGGVYCYLKHFVLSELGVNPVMVKTWITEQNLRENYLKPFEMAVKEGEANAIMSSFNCVGGTWSGASYACLTQILREEWGFRGSVITDYEKTSMKCKNGVRAGNSLWLNPKATNAYPLSVSDATDMYCAKMAAKDIVYTYVSTYQYAKTHDPEFSIKIADAVAPWWIPVLIGVDVVAVAGFLVVLLKPAKKKRK